MDRKIKNSIILMLIFVLVTGSGAFFTYGYQKGKIKNKKERLIRLNATKYDTAQLLSKRDSLQRLVMDLDSILARRKYNIPYGLKESDFFNFINYVSYGFNRLSFVNLEYTEQKKEKDYNHFVYNLSGTASFNDLFKIIYAIEESKMLKKINTVEITNAVKVEDNGKAHYLVNYKMQVWTYFADNDRLASSNFRENNLFTRPQHDIFYPLIRNEIEPNSRNLLDVQSAQLLALIPEGAFLTDTKGRTYLLYEGDEVYLGYLTKIDQSLNEVQFVLNKGGIVEGVKLQLNEKKAKSK